LGLLGSQIKEERMNFHEDFRFLFYSISFLQ
jgi:hypothetical protein